jgi:ankyrin repeat protein
MGGGAEMVRLLLDRGADPSLPDYEGRGARRLAEDMGRTEIAELFER